MTVNSPPPYNVVLLEDKIISEKQVNSITNYTCKEATTTYDSTNSKEMTSEAALLRSDEQRQVMLPEGKLCDDEITEHKRQFPKGFPENHYGAWMTLRIVLMTIGIPIMCKRSRRIRCHGHGGQCGAYEQDRDCRYDDAKERKRGRKCCNSTMHARKGGHRTRRC